MPASNAGDLGLIPGSGRSPGEGNGNPLWYSCLENPMDRKGVDLTEEEDIKKRWEEYTEELYKKDLHDPGNHNDVITNLEPDILECEVK